MDDGPDRQREAIVVDQRETPHGRLVLRRCGADFEIISDGMFLMDTRNGESERLLVSAALSAAANPALVLLGGLGVGFSLAEALEFPGVEQVTVVELHETIIEWNRSHFGAWMAHRLTDGRVSIVCDDLSRWLSSGDRRFGAICLDVDNGPSWLSLPSNAALYEEAGLASLSRRLLPGGVLGIWSAERSSELEGSLRHGFEDVSFREVAVPRGAPDVIYLAKKPAEETGPPA